MIHFANPGLNIYLIIQPPPPSTIFEEKKCFNPSALSDTKMYGTTPKNIIFKKNSLYFDLYNFPGRREIFEDYIFIENIYPGTNPK